MKKDIQIPEVKDVHVALIYEYNNDFKAKEWNAYILNNKDTPIELVFVVSKGYDGDIKTAPLRHSMAGLEPKSFAKLEFVQDEVLKLNNEFFVTFYLDGVLFEKKFLFKKNTINNTSLTTIPTINKQGILGK
ncbi:hypothetical protein CLV91_1033 [Maribacter vaceletii]|uniref:Phenylalanyl-tRNA synthetase subunit alpha n=1 Tax=Maribacter vaceletii TaxID=1206816 RepID=A0A495EE69_9FLAO|nr:hypothetical protein [Maribacter vaceletii]RKR14951.1 hypothetical protein CLV91_1033 [Maribacter vaceletii]